MSQGFNLKFDKMRENNPAASQDNSVQNPDRYDTPGHTRNVCFVWPDGKRMFFNYAYLISSEFDPTKETNEIRLEFSNHTIMLNGYGLENLFVDFQDHVPRIVQVIDGRYSSKIKMNHYSIINIQIKKND